jgi:hypothetical protein
MGKPTRNELLAEYYLHAAGRDQSTARGLRLLDAAVSGPDCCFLRKRRQTPLDLLLGSCSALFFRLRREIRVRWPTDIPKPPGQLIAGFRPYVDTRSVSRQKIADGHPRSVGSVKNQRIS